MNTGEAFEIVRAKPSDAADIARFVHEATLGRVSVAPQAVMDRFSIKGLWLVRNTSGKIVGLSGWRAENLIARVDDFLVFPHALYPTAGKALLDAIEEEARELQCEVCMIFVPLRAASSAVNFYRSCGYRRPESEGLPRVWLETVEEATEQGRYIMMKQLREDLVTRPI